MLFVLADPDPVGSEWCIDPDFGKRKYPDLVLPSETRSKRPTKIYTYIYLVIDFRSDPDPGQFRD